MNDDKLNARKSNSVKKELSIIRQITSKSWDSHWHDYIEVRLIVSGKGKVYINGEQYNLKKGSLYLTTPTNVHMFAPEGEVELYNITLRESFLFDESMVHQLFAMNEMFFQLHDDEFHRTVHLFELLEHENSADSEYKEQVVRKLLECLLLLFMRKMKSNFTAVDSRASSVQTAISFMKMHFRDDITADTVAGALGYSAGYFSTLFHETVGVTFIRYLSDMRLEYAAKLLNLTAFSVNEISAMSGFGSYSSFLKAFKKKFGVLPKEYKNSGKSA